MKLFKLKTEIKNIGRKRNRVLVTCGIVLFSLMIEVQGEEKKNKAENILRYIGKNVSKLMTKLIPGNLQAGSLGPVSF